MLWSTVVQVNISREYAEPIPDRSLELAGEFG